MVNLSRLLVVLALLSQTAFAATLPPVSGKKAMVVTSHRLASQVGLSILKHGGNAVDAAVAVGYALAVVDPCCGNIGGGGFMLIHQHDGKNVFINFREVAPRKLKPNDFFNPDGRINKDKIRRGFLAVGVPGTVLGLNFAEKRYGQLGRKKVMQPAIHLARDGFILSSADVKLFKRMTETFSKQKNVAKIFLDDGKPWPVGHRLIQKNLAHSLSLIAKQGSKAFYYGPISKAIVDASLKHGGKLDRQDFSNYQISISEPLQCHYRGLTVLTAPPPSSGATVCQILNTLEGYPLGEMGFHSADSVHVNVEAMRYAFADRNYYLADPKFVKIPLKKLIAKAYAASIRKKINLDKATDSLSIHHPRVEINEAANTTHYSIVDQQGNAVAVTYTLNGYFGAKVIAGDTGFFLNNELDDFSLKPHSENAFKLKQGAQNVLQGNKQPLSSMSPTLILNNNKVLMVLGAAGGPTIITTIIQTIENVIDYKMNIREALSAPRYHMQWLPDKIYLEPFAFSADTKDKLKQKGHHLQPGSIWGSQHWGQAAAIVWDKNTQQWQGAADPRHPNGLAVGE